MITLVDANNTLLRLHFSPAIQRLNVNYKNCGEFIPSGIVYVFITVLCKMFENRLPDEYFVFVWDGVANRKKEIYPYYKASRLPSSESVKCQRRVFKELLNVLDIRQVEMYGEEADDVIATLAIKARKIGQKVVIHSQDHDFEQIISNGIVLRSESGKGTVIKDVKWVLDNRGCHPAILGEAMQLTGDDGDDVAGVSKVGLVTAINLLKANGSLRVILRDVENAKMINRKGELVKITSKLAENINRARDQILLNRELVVLNKELDVDVDFSSIKKMRTNVGNFIRIINQYTINEKNISKWLSVFSYQ